MNVIENIAAAVMRADGWENVVLGLGGSKDPSAYTTFTSRAALPDHVLEALYVEDHFAAKVVEALPRAAMRAGWDLVLPGEPAAAARARDLYAAREDELEVAANMAEGACWGRVFGGALTWIGAADGADPSAPLNETSIESIRFLHTFDRRDVHIESYYVDPRHPKFRRPETYRIRPRAAMLGDLAGAGAVVHETRCILWPGQPTTDSRRLELAGWDDSVIQRCWDALRQIGEDYGAKSLLLGRVSQAVYKIKKLYDMVAGKQEEMLRRRMSILDASRSRSRSILLDTEEDFLNVAQPMGGVEALLDRSILRLAAAADMPVTVLMGQSPASMESTGESDLEVWTQTVEAWQTHELRRRHERITRLILLAKDGPTGGDEPEQWRIAYRPVRTPKPKELAEVRKLTVDTFSVAIDKGLAVAEEIAVQAFSPSNPVLGITLDEDALKAKLKRRRELDNQPPKDNAELGTVGARATSAMEIVTQVATKQIPRESGKALLIELFRFTPEVAEQILGPETFVPAPPPADPTPGPAPGARSGGGAGAPQGMPGFNAGGADNEPLP